MAQQTSPVNERILYFLSLIVFNHVVIVEEKIYGVTDEYSRANEMTQTYNETVKSVFQYPCTLRTLDDWSRCPMVNDSKHRVMIRMNWRTYRAAIDRSFLHEFVTTTEETQETAIDI